MTVKTAFKYIFIGLLTCFLLLVGYVVQAGIAIVHVRTPDTRLWVPVPVALGSIAGHLVDMPLKMERDFQEVWQYREAAADILRQLPGLPDAEFVEVRHGRDHVRIFKRADFLHIQVDNSDRKSQCATADSDRRTPGRGAERSQRFGGRFVCLSGMAVGRRLDLREDRKRRSSNLAMVDPAPASRSKGAG